MSEEMKILLVTAVLLAAPVGSLINALCGDKLRKPFARYRVQRMLAHSIPGVTSPVPVGTGRFALTRVGAKGMARRMNYGSSDGRGVYFGEIEKL